MECPHENPRDSNYCDAPEFALLDSRGPHPGVLVLSFGCLSALLVLVIVLGGPRNATQPPHAETLIKISVPRRSLWQPINPLRPAPTESAAPLPGPAEPAGEFSQPPVPIQAANDRVEAVPTPLLPRSELSVLPLPRGGILSSLYKPLPGLVTSRRADSDSRNPAPQAFSSLPLRQLLKREAELALDLAAIPANQRLAMPQVSIRVNTEWLQALPQTQEKLYFCSRTPQADARVLAYLPAARSFTWEHPQRPLWQIRDIERVPALAALRAAAARRLGVPPGLVGLYTWHPPLFESALRMFVLGRLEQMGARFGPRDVVTVRLASGPGGFVMNLEPVRAVEQLAR